VVKEAGFEVAHSLPPRYEVKNEWSYTSPSPIYIHRVHRDNCILTPNPLTWRIW